ncbi:aspartate aminotransferase [Aeropyrum pernix]|uniref:Aspartate aminotransferase n=1 Tax=Aeropyrum pernix TaxID=56636 RepID=A0A401H8A0_AERPX|nr:aspartate aminotransferase [Aeropyrum pernix]
MLTPLAGGYNKRVDLITGSPTRKIDAVRERLAREGRDVILLSTGQPGFLPPRFLRERLAQALLDEVFKKLYSYTPTPGYADVREAIAEDLAALGGPRMEPDDILVTAGGQEAMFAALSTILEPGDKVILMDPTYFGYRPIVEYLGGRVEWVRAPPYLGFQPDEERLKEAFTRDVKAVVLVSPDNPTGRLLSIESAKLVADLAVDTGAWIVYDEAYKTLVFEGEHVYLYKLAPDNTISINTFSKDPGFPGWRLGYLYGPGWIVGKIRLVSEELVYCPPSIAQVAAKIYLEDREGRLRHLEYAREFLKTRMEAMAGALEEMLPEAVFARPGGSMFITVDLSSYLSKASITSEDLSVKLLDEESVATVPGRYFGPSGDTMLRLSFATETPERIREGIGRLARLLERLA